MKLEFDDLEGHHVRLEPFMQQLKEEVRAAVDCDPNAWAIMPINPTAGGFDDPTGHSRVVHHSMRGCPTQSDAERIGALVGMSSYYTALASQGGIEIGMTFLHPNAPGSVVNTETKLLMLSHAFDQGAVLFSFGSTPQRTERKPPLRSLGAVREGVLRRDRLTWTGYVRDTCVFRPLADEWPTVRAQLTAILD